MPCFAFSLISDSGIDLHEMMKSSSASVKNYSIFGCISSAKINYINETTNGLRPGRQAILHKPLTVQAPILARVF
jgi:hypothetical protein